LKPLDSASSFSPSHALAKRLGAALLTAALLFAVGGCAKKDAKPKRKQVLLTTEYADAKVGREAAEQMAAEMGLIEDPKLTAYIEAIGKRLVPYAPQRRFDYTFHIIDQASPNAFALPGGFIYISRGLLQLANSEDELACVIGHEITHSAERHAASSQAYQRQLNPLSMGYLRAAKLASYGRDHERSADRGGQQMAALAGYDPMGMATFLKDMDAIERLTLGWSRLPSFFASHPATPERSAATAERAQQLKWVRRTGVAPTREAFLKTMEGLILGPNPREGVFRDNRFLHPDMQFSLRFPEGWRLINSHSAVGAVAPRGEAMVSLKLAGPGDDPEATAREFIEHGSENMRVKILKQGPMKVGDLPAYRIEGEAHQGGMKTGGHITFIAFEGFIYQINAVSAAADAAKYAGRTRSVARSFRALTEEEKGSFHILRLRVVPAMRGETIASLGQRVGNALDAPTTAVVNDVFIDTRLRQGQLIKIGVPEPYVGQKPEPPKLAPPESHDSQKGEGAEMGAEMKASGETPGE